MNQEPKSKNVDIPRITFLFLSQASLAAVTYIRSKHCGLAVAIQGEKTLQKILLCLDLFMPVKTQIPDNFGIYFITFTCFRWISPGQTRLIGKSATVGK